MSLIRSDALRVGHVIAANTVPAGEPFTVTTLARESYGAGRVSVNGSPFSYGPAFGWILISGDACSLCASDPAHAVRHRSRITRGGIASAHRALVQLGNYSGATLAQAARVTVSPSGQARMADAYGELRKAAHVVTVDSARAWNAFAVETMTQYAALIRSGIRVRVVSEDPYSGASEMFASVSRGYLEILSTRETGGHPILSDDVNDAFRAVHDVFGHAATGRGFDRHGEEAAWLAHSEIYSPLARLAMTTETRGQNAALIARGSFDAQRIGILPDWCQNAGALQPTSDEAADALTDAHERHAAQGLI